MPNVQVQLPFESLLNSLPQLTPEQLDIVAQKAAVMQAQRRVSHLDSAETKLLKQIEELVVSAESKARCAELTQQQQTEPLTITEEQELAALIDQMETTNAQRLALLVMLARLRDTDLDTLIAQLELSPLSYE